MSVHVQPIVCEGKEFPSIREFVNYYGLNYSKVQYYRKQGKSPKEIIEACQFSSASKSKTTHKTSSKRFTFEYNGIHYNSLYEAANTLGFPPAQLYELRKRHNLSPAAAIELAIKNREQKGVRPARHVRRCIIDGVEYESREAAIKAYGIPRITIYSRMEREGISFEEALSRGHKESIYRAPTTSLFSSLRPIPATRPFHQPTLEELETSLKHYKIKTQLMEDALTRLPILLADDSTFIFFNHDAHGLEIISILPLVLDPVMLNIVNGAYVNTKLYQNPMSGQYILSSFQAAKESCQEIKSVLHVYFAFVAIKNQLLKNITANVVTKSATNPIALTNDDENHTTVCTAQSISK